jgi:hypothetical protein
MAPKRGLLDAVQDRRVNKKSSLGLQSRKRSNHSLAKICISLLFGFAGGFAVGRWIRLI